MSNEAACRPPSGTTYLCVGQDLFSVNEYVTSQYNYSLHADINSTAEEEVDVSDSTHHLSVSSFVPSAFMVYTDLQTLRGLWTATDYGSGIQYADGLLDLFPSIDHSQTAASAGLQIGLWLNGTEGCLSICEGDLDNQIEQLITYLENTRASKIFLRLGYEFDNPSFGYSDHPELYILAFQKIVSDCRKGLSAEAQARVMFVWHSWGAPMASAKLNLHSFYPGDAYVDWIGVSIFQQVLPWSPSWSGQVSDVENVLKFAQEHNKPTMIAESTPFGGIELKQASNAAKESINGTSDPWDRWYGQVIHIIEKYDVDMWCYINCDWDSQPQWHNVGFGETRLSSNKEVMAKWHEQIMNGQSNRTFLHLGALDNCGSTAVSSKLGSDSDQQWFTPDHFLSFILVPFIVASAAFFMPYYMLGGIRGRDRSTKRERRPLLADINEKF
mmetsp:Transcript_10477/g.14994  ORF Transcript_10477/g.14994 Transcript_10477/m.14994 type:complete len:441 (-) Transcript_10477:480-1802(-)|eukprot:CAMPEP_0201692480 /NCGR_PEP_ID=MMETSP0578-20130828/5344_1 /ASSEMBLY_ACC=CAM_ASM_000663 /TAXON_ID=267565 /ORGANISM="Skeletonema grethea, Strain CCMP 1804" /LENGTH=440 /DNA_ID=CAMNT_0048177853 /DNA_START=72 /DNA_END=1394 /DNA_ORIENTATION=+